MGRDNFHSLEGLAKLGTLKLHRNLRRHTLADGVVCRLHEQGIVEQPFDGALADVDVGHGGL